LASKTTFKKSSVQPQPQPPASPINTDRRNKSIIKKSSPVLKRSTLSEDDLEELPANVDEVAMINNIKEEKENYNSSQEHNETLVSRFICIYTSSLD
jgi:striatin 1/3/4